MITATSPEQELAAWIFIKWFTSAEVMAEWSRMSGYFPTRAGSAALLGDYVETSPQWGQALELLPYSYYEPQLISYTAVRDGAQAAFNEIMQGDGSNIKAILDELTELANELQEELMAEVN
jgi:multiple sugar transport system substrate-binding protein/sn-glycerol 3-phosphate transport system substrate-binding protein